MNEMKFPGFDIDYRRPRVYDEENAPLPDYGTVQVIWTQNPPPLLERVVYGVFRRFMGLQLSPQTVIQMRRAIYDALNYQADIGALSKDWAGGWCWEVPDSTNPFTPHVEWADGTSEWRFWHDLGVELGLRKHCNDGPY